VYAQHGRCFVTVAADACPHAPQIFISIIQPYFLAGMVPLMGVYFVIQKFYRASYIEMQRIDATTRSPIYAHFSETLTGVETLRAYGFEERFALSNERKVDYNHRCGCLC
jgi:ATP-binding cassette, subfamily C (CFTR/MRP), member 1